MNYHTKIKYNYGLLTDLSKELNRTLGDNSGRTVSSRTAQGFKKLFKLNDIDENNAEDIIHAGMTTVGLLLNTNDDGAKTTGILLSLTLLFCYHAGK